MSLCFLLFHPKHMCSKFKGVESWQLFFPDAKLTKGMGSMPIYYEISSHEDGKKVASYWETIDVATDDAQNTVRFRLGGTESDVVRMESPPTLNVFITLSPESFSRLLAVNWKEQCLILTVTLKHPGELPKRLSDDVELPLDSYYIEWEERPIDPKRYLSKPNASRFPPELGVFTWRRRLRYYWLNDH